MSPKKSLKNNASARNYIQASLCLFTGTLAGILLAYILRDGTFHFDYSISHYVGREWWSAIIFLVSNLVVSWLWFKFAQAKKSEFGEPFAVFATMTVAMLIALSLCPIGLFDTAWGNYGVVSIMHQIFSRWMFGAMFCTIFAMCFNKSWFRRRQIPALAFLAYGTLCVVLSLTTQIFWDITFVFESAYIYFFIIILML